MDFFHPNDILYIWFKDCAHVAAHSYALLERSASEFFKEAFRMLEFFNS